MTSMPLHVCVQLAFVSVLLFGFAINNGVFADYSDVCVLGGGASGAASAVFLKQNGYSVRVIEKNSTLGGHCNTVRYTLNGQPAYVDIGVQAYINTSFCNANGFGSWAFDSVQFVTQFGVPIFPLGGAFSSGVTFNVDFKTGQMLNTAPLNVTQFEIAIGTLAAFVAQYPWLNTGDRPDPIPAELLVPFSQFIEENNLEVLALSVMNPFLWGGGSPPLEELSTLTALQSMSSSAIALITGASGGAFIIVGGCQTLYDSIATYLGSSVTHTATITKVRRGPSHSVVKGFSVDTAGEKQPFRYECGKLIVSFPPLLTNLIPWFDVTMEEYALFSQLTAQGYLALATTFTEGPLLAAQGFTINNVDPSRPEAFSLPAMPNLSIFSRGLPVGPAAAWVNSQSSLIPAEVLLGVAELQFSGIPSSLMSNISVMAWSLHEYGAHWYNWAQVQSPSPDTVFRALQGQHNTFWVGATVTIEGSHVVWNHAYNLIQQNFPKKN